MSLLLKEIDLNVVRLNIKLHSRTKSPIFLFHGINYCGGISSESHSLCMQNGKVYLHLQVKKPREGQRDSAVYLIS